MALDALALSTLLRACAPHVGSRTMTAIVRVESGADPNAIYDNTQGRAYTGLGTAHATNLAAELLARGDVLDLGLAQIDSANLARVGLNVREIFDPCANLRAGSRILGDAYRSARDRFGDGQFALRRAIGAYNTGSIYGGATYVSSVLAAAGIGPDTDIDVPDLTPLGKARPASAPDRRPAPKRRGPIVATPLTPFTAPLTIDARNGRFSPAVTKIQTAGVARGTLLPAGAQSPISRGQTATITP